VTDTTPEPRLTSEERAEAILTEVQRSGFASITALSETLAVSDMTIRRDVRRLAQGGDLRLVHGGVSLAQRALRTATFAGRADQEAHAKRLIAEAAVKLLGSSTSVAIDSGTTCAAVAAALPSEFRGTVITHSVPVLQQLMSHPQTIVLGLGGELLPESQVLIGPRTTAAAQELSVDVFFLGVNSVDSQGMYLRGDREFPIKSTLIKRASRVVLLADGSKLTHTAPVKLADLDTLTSIITNGPVPADLRQRCADLGIDLVIADSADQTQAD
jgi:DeoR family transcriptional regulator, fructose operon transcriptional repressor